MVAFHGRCFLRHHTRLRHLPVDLLYPILYLRYVWSSSVTVSRSTRRQQHNPSGPSLQGQSSTSHDRRHGHMPYATCPWSDTAPTSERPWLQAPRTPFSASSTRQDTTRQPSLQKIQALQRRPSARWHDLCACVCNPPHHVGTGRRGHILRTPPSQPIPLDPIPSDPLP